MAQYRLYFRNSRTRRIEDVLTIAAEDDQEAVQRLDELRGERALELWLEARNVRSWPAQLSPSRS